MSKSDQIPVAKKPEAKGLQAFMADFCKEAREEQIQRYRKRLKSTPPPPCYEVRAGCDGESTLAMRKGALLALLEACGTTDPGFAQELVCDFRKALRQQSIEDDAGVLNSGLAVLSNLSPSDELEAMLVAQMVATHKVGMDMLGRAMRAETLLPAQWLSGFAIKLLRTYTMQMEALQRYRGKGGQTVRVEHVTVNAGGQAIVGTVAASGKGGVKQNVEKQSHAK